MLLSTALKKIIFSGLTPLALCASEDKSTINNTSNPTYYNYNYNYNSAAATLISHIESATKVSVEWIYNKTKKLQETKDQIQKDLQNFLWEKRYHLTGLTVLAGYSWINYQLIMRYFFIKDPSLWSNWKINYSFENLCAIPQKTLANELILSICTHVNPKNPTDTTYSLITFINTIDNEIKIITDYITMGKKIKKMKLIKLFSINDQKIAYAEQLLQRAHFIRHIFLSWLSEFNLGHIAKK